MITPHQEAEVVEVITRTHPWYTVFPLTAILVYLLTLTGYWQLILAAGVLAGILMKRPWASFGVSMLAAGLAWGIPLVVATPTFHLDEASALLLQVLGLCPCLFIVPFALTALIAAITAGLGALLGAYGYLLTRRPGEASARPPPE